MNWEAASALSEIIAAFGIIGSLIYVGLQTRQNTGAIRIASVRENMTTFQGLFSAQIDSKETADMMVRGMDDLKSLDTPDRLRFYALNVKSLRFFESMFWQWRHGGLDGEMWQAYARQITDFLTAPGMQQIWTTRRHQFHQGFVDFADAAISGDEGHVLFPEAN